jgi:hypothetical protein
MGIPHPPEKSLLFIAVLYSKKEIFNVVVPMLSARSGEILFISPESSWDHSQYYDKELGKPVYRRFIFFKTLFAPETLPDKKLETNAIERVYSQNGKRMINLDPGYIMLSRVVLASAKDYSHRIYLGKGIYGELALYYEGNSFNPLPYTYQDYRDRRCLEVFEKARKELKRLKADSKQLPGCPCGSLRRNI